MAIIAGGLLAWGMCIPPTMETASGNAPGQQLVSVSLLLSVAGLLTSCRGLLLGRARHLPVLRAGAAATLCLAIAIAGWATVLRQIKALDRADRLDATFDYLFNFGDISETIDLEVERKSPINREAYERIRGLCGDISALRTRDVEADLVAAVRQYASIWENHFNLVLEHQNILDKRPSRFSEEECSRRLATSQQEAFRHARAIRDLQADLRTRFAGVVPWPRSNQGWARVALYCVDETTDARCAKSVPEISKAFGHYYKDDQIVNVSMESLDVNLDLIDIRKKFGPPDRAYRMRVELHHVYGKLVLVTPDVTGGPPRQLTVRCIGAPYSWWVGGLRSRAVADLNSENRRVV